MENGSSVAGLDIVMTRLTYVNCLPCFGTRRQFCRRVFIGAFSVLVALYCNKTLLRLCWPRSTVQRGCVGPNGISIRRARQLAV